MRQIKEYIQQANVERLLYYIAFFLIITCAFMRTTMFGKSPLITDTLEDIGILIIFLKIVKYQRTNRKLFLALAGIIGIAMLVGTLSSSYSMILSLTMITIGAINVPFKKIAKEYFYITFILLTVTVICSLTGVIENLQYTFEIERGVRNSFGIVYPTDFASHVLFIMLSFMIAYEEKFNIFYSVIGIVIAAAVYFFCDTRVDCVCMILVCAGIPVIKALKGKNIPALLKKICAQICTWSMPIAAAVMIFLTAIYTPSSPLSKLDQIINGRLAWGREGFNRYPVTLFGQYVKMVGAGGSTTFRSDYFFVDCSYIYCLLKFGIIMTLLIIAAYVFIGMRYKHSGLILWFIAITALNCMIAHHLPDVAYVFFTAAVFAQIDASAKDPGSTDPKDLPST